MTDLFEGAYPDVEPEPVEKLSADRRRTIRQREDIARGVHPLTKRPLLPGVHTCGDCVHRVHETNRRHSWPKCDLTSMSWSAASDCRAWWPACDLWKAVDNPPEEKP